MAGNKPEEEKEEKGSLEKVEIPDLLIKHPLQNAWTLWYFENDRKKDWSQNLKDIITVDSVEDFWSLYNHIKPASELKAGCDYNFFKKGIRPMWEDAANKEGGRWLIQLDKKQRTTELDNYWLEMLLLMIGEGFDDCSDEINGAVVNVRGKLDKIALWTANGEPANKLKAIGRKLKERLKIDAKQQIQFQLHADTASVQKSSSTKATYSV